MYEPVSGLGLEVQVLHESAHVVQWLMVHTVGPVLEAYVAILWYNTFDPYCTLTYPVHSFNWPS